MFAKEIVGAVAGGIAGYGYHVLMRCVDSKCINRRYPLVPIITLGAVGVGAVWFWWK